MVAIVQWNHLVAILDPRLFLPGLYLVGALLLGAVVIALVRRWQQDGREARADATDQLGQYRSLYEKGEISKEEYHRLRAVLAEEMRRTLDLPAVPDRLAAPDDSGNRKEGDRGADGETQPPDAAHPG